MKQFFVRQLIKSLKLYPSFIGFSIVRKKFKIQLTAKMLCTIAKTIQSESPCNLLVFGLGNDSTIWSFLNTKGTTVFLEDNEKWFKKITCLSRGIQAYLVDYNTKLKDWKDLLEDPSLLAMDVPSVVRSTQWDIILVDAPAGWGKGPGRMKSIYQASQLVKPNGHVFVHDCEREIENVYSHTFLKKENLRAEISNLRHYCIST